MDGQRSRSLSHRRKYWQTKKFPESLIAIEMSLKYFNVKKRSDIVVYNNLGNPILIIECKAPSVEITQSTFEQIATYNMALNVKYLIVTNGLTHYCCKMDYQNNSYTFIDDIPMYNDM